MPSIVDFRMAPPRRIELLLHQMRGRVDHVHLAAVVEQAARRFQPQQAAADHRRLRLRLLRAAGDAVAVVEGAEAEDAGLAACRRLVEDACDRRDEGAAAGGDQQRVVVRR